MGLDVGGTAIKGLVIDEKGKIVCEDSVPTRVGEELLGCIEEIAEKLVRLTGKTFSGLNGIGV